LTAKIQLEFRMPSTFICGTTGNDHTLHYKPILLQPFKVTVSLQSFISKHYTCF